MLFWLTLLMLFSISPQSISSASQSLLSPRVSTVVIAVSKALLGEISSTPREAKPAMPALDVHEVDADADADAGTDDDEDEDEGIGSSRGMRLLQGDGDGAREQISELFTTRAIPKSQSFKRQF